MPIVKVIYDVMEIVSTGPGNIIELEYPKDSPKYKKEIFVFFKSGNPTMANLPFMMNENKQLLLKNEDRIGIVIKILNNKIEEEDFIKKARGI